MSERVANLLYRSETSILPGSAAAEHLLGRARERNRQLGLTGFLHHEEGFFFQWLEGPAANLAAVQKIIESDPRHEAVTYLHRGTEAVPQFPDWRMGYSQHEDDSLLEWLAREPVAQIKREAYARSILMFLKERSRAQHA